MITCPKQLSFESHLNMDMFNSFSNIQLISALVVFIVTATYVKYRRTYSFWSSRGVKGPTPLPFFGNSLDLILRSPKDVELEYWRKYGDVYGTYDGSKPVLIVTDLTILKDILISQFHIFSEQSFFESPDPLDSSMLFSLSGERWKRVRSIVSTAFTTTKMRQMSAKIKSCKVNFFRRVSKLQAGDSDVRLKDLFTCHVADIAAKCFYSLDIDFYEHPNHDFLKHVSDAFSVDLIGLFIMSNFPGWVTKCLGIGLSPATSMNYFKTIINHIRQSRLDTNERSNDLFQVLLDSRDTDAEISGKGMTDIELTANGIVFLAGANDATVITMSVITWMLALHPDVQDKLFREITGIVGTDFERDVSYDDLVQFHYLEAVINETLRLHSIVDRSTRRPTQDATVPGTDIQIPKGTQINTPVYVLNLNPEHFENPQQFKPERFLPENKDALKSCSFLSFGTGPRMCVGIRFAFTSMKQTIAELVRRYKIVRSVNTVSELNFPRNSFILDASSLIVKLEKRA